MLHVTLLLIFVFLAGVIVGMGILQILDK